MRQALIGSKALKVNRPPEEVCPILTRSDFFRQDETTTEYADKHRQGGTARQGDGSCV